MQLIRITDLYRVYKRFDFTTLSTFTAQERSASLLATSGKSGQLLRKKNEQTNKQTVMQQR